MVAVSLFPNTGGKAGKDRSFICAQPKRVVLGTAVHSDKQERWQAHLQLCEEWYALLEVSFVVVTLRGSIQAIREVASGAQG